MAEYDKTEIVQVLNLYGFALDSHQFELFDLVFTEDVRAEFGPAGAIWHGLGNLKRTFDDKAEGGSSWLGTGWYDDELVRTSNGWRIRDRVAKLLSWTGNPLVPGPVPEHNPDMNKNILSKACEAGAVRFFEAVRAKKHA